MPRSEKQKSSRLKAAVFCLGIYLCSFFVVNHYISKYHAGQRISTSHSHAAFGQHFSQEAQIWYEAYCHRQTQQQVMSEKVIREKLHESPGNAELHFQFAGLLNQEKGQEAQALIQYRRAVSLQPKIVLYHLTFATMLQQHGQDKEALAQFQSATMCPSHPLSAQYEVGCLLCKQGQQREGIAILTKISHSSDRYWSFAAASRLRGITQTSLHV